MEQITFKIARFTAKNTLEKPYKTNKKTIDINKIKYIQTTGLGFIIYYFKGRPSQFNSFWLFNEHLQWIKDDRRDYEDILKDGHYKGAYLLEDNEIVNLLKTKFEPISKDSHFYKRKGQIAEIEEENGEFFSNISFASSNV